MRYVLLLFLSFLYVAPSFGQTTSENTLCYSGDSLLEQYKYPQALAAFLKCKDRHPHQFSILEKIAYCQNQLGQWQAAESSLQAILKQDSNAVSARNHLARLYQKTGQYKAALQQYTSLVRQDTTNSYYYKSMGKMAVKLADIPTGIALLEQALRYNPSDMDVITDLVRIYQELQLFPQADSLTAMGLQQDSTNLALLQFQAVSAYKQKQYKKVQRCVQHVLELKTDSSAYLLKLLGVAHFHLEEPQRAIRILEQVVAKKQDSEIIHYYLGLSYQALQDYEQSLKHFEQAIDFGVSKHLGTYYTNLAIVLEQQGDHGEAIRAYQAAYKSTQDQILLYHLARNYDAYYKNKKTALRYYQRYLEANDTANAAFADYSEHRISELQKIIHFDLDSLE